MSGSTKLGVILAGPGPTYPTAAGAQVAPDIADESWQEPYIVYRRTNVERFYGVDSSLHTTRETFQIECWGKTRASSENLESQVVAALAAENIPLSPNEPDGFDPEILVRAVVLTVDLWTDP